MPLRWIISGGQTGADQGGLDAGKALGLKTGGLMPKGWRTEAGPRPGHERALWDAILWGSITGMIMTAVTLFIFIMSETTERSFGTPALTTNAVIILIASGLFYHFLPSTADEKLPGIAVHAVTFKQREADMGLVNSVRSIEVALADLKRKLAQTPMNDRRREALQRMVCDLQREVNIRTGSQGEMSIERNSGGRD